MGLQCTGTVKISALTLSDDLVLRNLRAPTIKIESQRTKGGINLALVHRLSGGHRLELAGWFTTEQVEQLQALEGQAVTLVHPRGTYEGALIEELQIEPAFEHVEREADALEQGSIFILTR